MPLTWRRIALVLAALAAFALLFPVPAVRTFYKLELPHSALQGTLLIAALGAATLAGFWALTRRRGPGPGHVAANDLNRPA
jgi:membrane protease YdiL (CAAX protease family)